MRDAIFNILTGGDPQGHCLSGLVDVFDVACDRVRVPYAGLLRQLQVRRRLTSQSIQAG